MALRILKAVLLFCTGVSIVLVGIMTVWFINEVATISPVLQSLFTIPIFLVTLAWCGYFSLKAVSVMSDKPMSDLIAQNAHNEQ